MKTLAPAARVWSPGAPVLGAARPGAGTRGRHSRPRRAGWESVRCKPRQSPKPAPSPRLAPRPSAQRSVRRSVCRLQASAAAADAGGATARPPAGWRAPSHPQLRPPPAPPAAPPPAACSSARRLSLGEPRARVHGLGRTRVAVAPRRRATSSFPRSPLRPLPFSPPLLRQPGAPTTPERCGGVVREDVRRKEGGREAGRSTPIGSSLTAVEEQRVRCLSATRTGGQLLEGRWGEGRSGASGLGASYWLNPCESHQTENSIKAIHKDPRT
ncbi:uncharacterized protein RBU33_001362 [Hipposideros larvatus]